VGRAASCASQSDLTSTDGMHIGTADRISEVADSKSVQALRYDNEYVCSSELGLLFGVQSTSSVALNVVQSLLVNCTSEPGSLLTCVTQLSSLRIASISRVGLLVAS
jgi:hypothetical protein